MTSVQEVLFSSFLSGALLQKNSLSYSELATLLTVFSTTNDIVVYEPDNDCDKLTDFVDFEENRIVLKQTVMLIRFVMTMLTIALTKNFSSSAHLKKFLRVGSGVTLWNMVGIRLIGVMVRVSMQFIMILGLVRFILLVM